MKTGLLSTLERYTANYKLRHCS